MAKKTDKKKLKKQKSSGKTKQKKSTAKKTAAKKIVSRKKTGKKVAKTKPQPKIQKKPKSVSKAVPQKPAQKISKTVPQKPAQKKGKGEKHPASFPPRPPLKEFVPPPPDESKANSKQLSMAFEEAKPVISSKPRITRSKSGNLVYQLEYTIRSSPMILYEFLTTPSCLAQWFADSVDINDHRCSFEWEGVVEMATIIDSIADAYIRYKWDNSGDDEYFEFRISKNEITGDTILTITDFAPENEIKDEKLLWDSQVKLLTQQVGG